MSASRFRLVTLGVIALAIALGAGVTWWCRDTHPQLTERRLTLYYLDPQGMYLVPVQERVAMPAATDKGLQATLDELVTHTPQGLMAPVAAGSRVTVKGVHDGHADVTVRLAGPALGGGTEQLMAGSLVRTAGSLDSIHEVSLSLQDAQGKPYESEHLDLSQPMTPTDPGMENLYLGGEGQGLAVTVYFRIPGSSYLVPLRVPLPSGRENEPLKGSFALLLDGPPSDIKSFLAPSLDAATQLRWNGLEGDVAQVLWRNAPEATPSALAIRALVLTLTDSGRIKAVRLTREGVPLTGQVGPFDLSRPITRPDAVNPLDSLPARASLLPIGVS